MYKKRVVIYLLTIAFLLLGGAFIYFYDSEYIEGNVLNLPMLTERQRAENPYIPVWLDSNLLEYLLYPPLILSNAERTAVKPHLVENYSISADGLIYTFNIKKNITWSDGIPLTGHDAKFSFEIFTSKKGHSIHYVDIAKKLVKLESTDTAFVLHLNAKHAPLLDYISQIAIMPKHIMEKVNLEDFQNSEFWKNPVVSGMYNLKEENEDIKILAINPHYFATKPHIEEIHLHANTRMNYDLYLADSVEKIINYNGLRSYKAHFMPTQRYRYLSYNIEGKDGNTNPPMQDIHVREAIATAIDRAYIVKNIYNNISTIPIHRKNIKADELPIFDNTNAKEALAKSNYDLNRPLRLAHYYNNTNAIYFINRVVQDLEAIGFKVEVIQEDTLDILLAKRNFDIIFKDFTSPTPIDRMLDLGSSHKFSALLGGKGEFDELLTNIRQEHLPVVRTQLEEELYEKADLIFYTYPIMSLAYANYVHYERVYTPSKLTFAQPVTLFDFQFENWKIKKN